MFTVQFGIEHWNGVLSKGRESFKVIGSARVRVKKGFSSGNSMGGEISFTAKSTEPFVVVVTMKASGEGSNRYDGRTTILVATDETGNPGARIVCAAPVAPVVHHYQYR